MNTGFNLELEKQHREDTDWVFGATSKPSTLYIPLNDREKYFPIGERQNVGMEKSDCASRAPINALEFQFNFGYANKLFRSENLKWLEERGYIKDGKVTFSDRAIAILSGTDPLQGNSLKKPIDTIYRFGLIPKSLFPQVESRDEYYDKSKITEEMYALGEEFLKRFTINYEQVREEDFGLLLQKEIVGSVAGYAWPPPRDGVYPKNTFQPNHAFMLYSLPKFQAYDNYLDWSADNTKQIEGDFTKNLAEDYDFWNVGYRIFISAENVPEDKKNEETVLETLIKHGLVQFFVKFLEIFREKRANPVVEIPKEVPKPDTKPKPDLLGLMCDAIKVHEGYFPPSMAAPKGSRSWRNRNPGNLKYAGQAGTIGKDDKNFAIFKTFEDGLAALRRMIVNAAEGKSKVYKPTMTLLEFFSIYAPSSDNNNPKMYAEYVAKRMGVTIEFKINQLL